MDAVDIAATMIAAGRGAPGGDHPHIRWVCSPLETFAADPPYALIIAGSSLHWMEWEVVLPRFARATRKCWTLIAPPSTVS